MKRRQSTTEGRFGSGCGIIIMKKCMYGCMGCTNVWKQCDDDDAERACDDRGGG